MMKRKGDTVMKRKIIFYFSFFFLASVITISSCVIPGSPDTLIELEAKPERNLVPVGAIFDPKKELTVIAFFNTGEVFYVPGADWIASTLPDTFTPGEQSGSVEYQGKTASYTIFVYDTSSGSNGPYNSGGPEMHVPL
jgi:hypothetical protein